MVKAPSEDFVAFIREHIAEKSLFIPGAQGEVAKTISPNSPIIKNLGAQAHRVLETAAYYDRFWSKEGLIYGYYNRIFSTPIRATIENMFYDWCEGNTFSIDGNRGLIRHGALVFRKSESGKFIGIGVVIADADYQSTVPKIATVSEDSGLHVEKITDHWHYCGYPTRYFDFSFLPHYNLGDRELRLNCFGDDVRELQTLLITLGYSCGPRGATGNLNKDTQDAIIAFNTANGISEAYFTKTGYNAIMSYI